MAIDIGPLWDFDHPEVSEQRFREALSSASPDDQLILQTQIARTYGLRRDFERARGVLKTIEPQIQGASPQAQVRYALELGRTYASAAHTQGAVTAEEKDIARTQYAKALEIAKSAKLDSLGIDAVHMLAFVDTAPADQLRWAQEALAVVEETSQPAAKQWEASIRNNMGYALHQLGRFEEALAQFELALALREKGTNAEATLIARWMIAWTLRALGRIQEALDMQLKLESACAALGKSDQYVLEELELLYRQRGDTARADAYAQRRKALKNESK
jgi:tetratricopeptide (TPR) repeat protein